MLNSTVDTESEEFMQEKRLKDFDAGSCAYKSTPVVLNRQSIEEEGNITQEEEICQQRKEALTEISHNDLFEDVEDISTNDKTLVSNIAEKVTNYKYDSNGKSEKVKESHVQCENVDVFEDVLSIFVSPLTQNSQSSLRSAKGALKKRKLSMNSDNSQLASQESKLDISAPSSGSSCKKAKLSPSQIMKDTYTSKAGDNLQDVIERQNQSLNSDFIKDITKDVSEDYRGVVTPTKETQNMVKSGISTNIGSEDTATPCKSAIPEAISPGLDCFTQISPTSLNAMYDAAEMPTSHECEPTVSEVEVNPKIKDNKIFKDHARHIEQNFQSMINNSENAINRNSMTLSLESNTEKARYVSPLFASSKTSNSITPVKWKNSEKVLKGDKSAFTEPQKDLGETRPSEPKSLILRNKKAKRFSYPSSSQITDICPQRVFKFETNLQSNEKLSEKSSSAGGNDKTYSYSDNVTTRVDLSSSVKKQNSADKTPQPNSELNVTHRSLHIYPGKENLSNRGEMEKLLPRKFPKRHNAGR